MYWNYSTLYTLITTGDLERHGLPLRNPTSLMRSGDQADVFSSVVITSNPSA
jgi:hypothetical protein